MPRAKKYEECSYVEQAGWAAGVHAYLNDEREITFPYEEDHEGFIKYMREVLMPGRPDEFYDGALMGIKAEDGQ